MAAGMCSLLLLSLLLLCIVGSCKLCHASWNKNYCYDDELCPGAVDHDTRGGPVAGKLNVHLVPHTHDDVGWLKTVDQYYVGSNNSIQVAAVQYVLDSVILALQEDPNRKFIYVEQAFFQRWWREQSKHKRKIVKRLVKAGQLEFINGGWCMHDEASTHYVDMVDQTTLGHRYIKKQFNTVPRIGWQIDPFGHSAIQAYLLGAEVGFDAVFFARADYQDIAKRRIDRTMEFVWQGSRTLGSTAQILGGVLSHHYTPPDGFRFDIQSREPPIQDDLLLYDINVQEHVDLFVKLAVEQGKEFRTNHIMWTMGDDFAYENANTWFKQIDKLIHYVNKDGRVNAFYSTPSIYVDANHAQNVSWPLKIDDFFPYADCPHCYWTGYFTSRPALKRYVRQLSAYLQVARQLEFLIGKGKVGLTTDSLEEAMAILQHHDGVSGTEKQHVADDYAKRLALGAAEAEELVGSVLPILLSSKLEARHRKESSSEIKIVPSVSSSYRSQSLQEVSYFSVNTETLLKVQQCSLLNISYCPPTEADIVSGKSLVVVAYNSLGWAREELIRIPVTNSILEVKDSKGNIVSSQLIPISSGAKKVRNIYISDGSQNKHPIFWLAFHASVPPFGYNSYFVTTSMANIPNQASKSVVEKLNTNDTVVLKSHDLTLSLSRSNGQLMHFENRRTKTNASIQQSYCWYNASDGNTSEGKYQASGAYIFRPNTSTCFPVGDPDSYAPSTIIRGTLVDEIHQEISPWIFQVVRLVKTSEHVEVEFVGPIPIDDELGKELVTRLYTNISNVGEFYTDSNGRDFLKRVRNYRSDWNLNVTEPIAGNYYPVNLGIYLKDNEKEFSLLVDRALGGSSLIDGELEVMLHRRLLHDDGRGVAEALNESICISNGEPCQGLMVQGQLCVNIDPVGNAARWRRTQGQKIYSPLQLAFTVIPETDHSTVITPEFSSVIAGYELPPNIVIITLQELDDNNLLLRFAHIYEANEDAELSEVATINLENLFAHRKIDKVSELSLSANQLRSKMNTLKWKLESGFQMVENPVRGAPIQDGQFSIEIAPMEIRTLRIKFKNDE
ncbi:hypothetical protein O6H91_17G079900 [Diphasiastrum complanatum]|uniref:Uncharacterized protein n=1 Tax=Diphasiastrum complanatum TaxID=34168 RepID=A0ACC2B9F3_DIPCM|nr:hypothetical protein O6H91_17G079900 [Diphasiastrum complanatum]